MRIDVDKIKEELKGYSDPLRGKDLVDLGIFKNHNDIRARMIRRHGAKLKATKGSDGYRRYYKKDVLDYLSKALLDPYDAERERLQIKRHWGKKVFNGSLSDPKKRVKKTKEKDD